MNSLWSDVSGNIVSKSDAKNNYNVGIGNNGSNTVKLSIEVPTTNTTLTHGLKVKNSSTSTSDKYGIQSILNNSSNSSNNYGIYSSVTNSTGYNYGIYSFNNNTSSSNSYGLYSNNESTGDGDQYGLYLNNNASGSGTDWGIYTTGEDKNFFFGKTGIGESSPEYKLDVQIGNNDGISARFEGNIQIDQTDNANRAYGFVSTNNTSTMIGGNLRFNDLETGGTHDGYSKGTNDRGSAGLIMDNSNASTGVFRFINATDTDTDSYSISELMRITSSGDVGIGTDTQALS